MATARFKKLSPPFRIGVVVLLVLCSLLHFLSVERVYFVAARELLEMLLNCFFIN